jgi:hypothetical protein
MKLLSNILAPVSCVTVAEGTQLLRRNFSIFFLPKREKRKKQQGVKLKQNVVNRVGNKGC